MKTLLHITTSISGENGHSNRLSKKFIAQWQAQNPDSVVVLRDLAANPMPHFEHQHLQAFSTAASERTPAQQALVAYSDSLIDELDQADVLVLGAPLYNFGMPSTLKAYFDQIARAGVTFRYTTNGPEGLLADIPVYVFAASGGKYADSPVHWQLNTFLNFIGFKSVHTVLAEGLNLGHENAEKSLIHAHKAINELMVAHS